MRPATCAALSVAFGAVAAGCSAVGGSSVSPSSTTVDAPAALVPVTQAAEPAVTTTVKPPPVLVVSATVSIEALDLAAELSGEVAADVDLFGDFVTCSGFADEVGAYQVGVGSTSGPVRRLSIASVRHVDGAGSYDADVRVERRTGDPIDGEGSVTLDEDMTGGIFRAVAADGVRVEGSFECSGGAGGPTPIGADGTDGVEVVALVRRGDDQRVVALASDDPVRVACPAGVGGQALIVSAEGDAARGAVRSFALTAAPSGAATLRLQVGATLLEFDDVEVELGDPATTGLFAAGSGTTTTIDGAFSCG